MLVLEAGDLGPDEIDPDEIGPGEIGPLWNFFEAVLFLRQSGPISPFLFLSSRIN